MMKPARLIPLLGLCVLATAPGVRADGGGPISPSPVLNIHAPRPVLPCIEPTDGSPYLPVPVAWCAHSQGPAVLGGASTHAAVWRQGPSFRHRRRLSGSSQGPVPDWAFKRLGSGASSFVGLLPDGSYAGYLARSRAGAATFGPLLSPLDEQRVEHVNYRRFAVAAMFSRVPACGWSARISGVVDFEPIPYAIITLRPRATQAACDSAAGYVYWYDVVKVVLGARKGPAVEGMGSRWHDVAPATVHVNHDPIASWSWLPPSDWCSSSLDRSTCVFSSSLDSVRGVPVVHVSPGDDVRPGFMLGDDWTRTFSLSFVSSRQQFTTVTEPLWGSWWHVPAGFTTGPEGLLAVIHTVGDQANVDYLVRFVSSKPNMARPPWVAPVGGGIP
jgi:hypothetical protein